MRWREGFDGTLEEYATAKTINDWLPLGEGFENFSDTPAGMEPAKQVSGRLLENMAERISRWFKAVYRNCGRGIRCLYGLGIIRELLIRLLYDILIYGVNIVNMPKRMTRGYYGNVALCAQTFRMLFIGLRVFG